MLPGWKQVAIVTGISCSFQTNSFRKTTPDGGTRQNDYGNSVNVQLWSVRRP